MRLSRRPRRVWLSTDAELALSDLQLRAACRLAASRQAAAPLVETQSLNAAVLALAARRIRSGECVRHGVRACTACAGPHAGVRVLRTGWRPHPQREGTER